GDQCADVENKNWQYSKNVNHLFGRCLGDGSSNKRRLIMMDYVNGWMDGSMGGGIGPVIGILVVVLLVIVIINQSKK
ncbi:MAG: hypothetical protein Q8O64_03555, partial [Sideroxyarcus sp.]|nr:hypothetical protein [Sideroxyarcus sp.]